MRLIFYFLLQSVVLLPSETQTETFNFVTVNCDTIPITNQKVLDFANSQLNKRVGRGECWDLANQALEKVGAQWNHEYIFGEKVNYQDTCVFPGDIIQFENVKAKYVENGVSYQEIMLHHTAIIQKVMDKNRFILIHQNYQSKKKVVTSHFDIQTMTQGKIEIFRPTVSEK